MSKQVCYGISSFDSNAMKSNNPESGIYVAETSRTLDLNGGNPACNQGGVLVVCIEGNGQRKSHKGDGLRESAEMYTLNTTEVHAVAYQRKALCFHNRPFNVGLTDTVCPTLTLECAKMPGMTLVEYEERK